VAWAVELTVKLIEVSQSLGENVEKIERALQHSPILEKKTSIWDAYTAAAVRVEEFINMIEPQPKGN
jgi:hypothetical protein